MGKRILSMCLALCMVAGLVIALPITASAESSGKCGDNLTWTLDDSGTLTISGFGDMWGIWGQCPWIRDNIKSVVIGDGTTSIGGGAFKNCYYLNSVSIPSSVKIIDSSAFYSCYNLTNIIIPNGVTSINNCAFYECSRLKNISIPDNVTYIDSMAFKYTAYYYDSSNWDNNVLYISNCLICTKPERLYGEYSIREGTTFIAEYAFSGCSNLQSIIIPSSLHRIPDEAFVYSGIRKITIPESISEIGYRAFYNCKYLYDISIPHTITNIGGYAFRGCSRLAEIEIPNSVTSIGYGAFQDCTNLERITLPTSINSISSSMFAGCTKLKEVTIPENMKKIDDYAFCGCTCIAEFSIPDSITELGSYIFKGCENLHKIKIGNGVTEIHSSMFYGCDNVQQIILGSNVNNINSYAFDYTLKLKNITISEQNQHYTAQDCVIFNKDKTSLIKYLPSKSNTTYVMPNTVKNIEEYAFANNEYIFHVTLSEALETIEDYAFSYCKKLTEIDWNANLKTIEHSAFSDCGFTEIALPHQITYLGGGVFACCEKLTGCTLPNSLKIIEYGTFEGCTSLTSLNIPDSVTSIAYGAFGACTSLIKVEIGKGLKYMGDKYADKHDSFESGYSTVFSDCTNLKEIKVSEQNERFCSDENGVLFSKDKTYLICYPANASYNHYSIPNTVKTICDYAFYGNKNMSQVTIPDSVTSIGDGAFYYCTSLTSVTMPDSVKNIGSVAFADSISLNTVYIPSSITEIGDYAFGNCKKLRAVYYNSSAEQWYDIGGYHALTHTKAKLYCNGIETLPYTPKTSPSNNGTTDFDSASNSSKPYYSNTVKSNSSITGDYTIKDSNVTVSGGKSLNISGKLTIENGNLYIQKDGKVTAQSIEIKTKGNISIGGEVSTISDIIAKGGSNSNNGGSIEIGQNGIISSSNVSLYDYATISLYGKLYANSFLIKTKTNLSNFGAKGEMWLKGDFTQQKNGAAWWQSRKESFCPQSGFSVILENNGRMHNISFDTPEQSYLYNLYSVTDGSTTAVWEGNPTIKGRQASVIKNAIGYTINKKDNTESTKTAKNFKSEIASIMNGKSATSVSYGISDFGGMYSETNKVLEKYLYAYTAGIDALYPSVIDVSTHTWYEIIPVYYNGKYKDVKFGFEIVNWMGNKVVNIKYSYGNTQNKQCFTFFSGNKNELANTIRKYATDTYNSAMADYFCIPFDKYVKNKKSKLADLLWDGIQNISVVGTGSGKKTVKSIIKKGVNKYLDKVEKTIGASVLSTDSPTILSLDDTSAVYNSDIILLLETDETENIAAFETEASETVATNTFTDTYLISAIKEELGLGENDEFTLENLETVEGLDLSSSYITDLSGIGQCKNLKKLDLSGNAVSDLSPLSELTSLTALNLNGNSVSDLTPIADLVNLENLALKNNLLTDLSSLKNLTALTDLDLGFNTISDISSLEKLVNIRKLNLTNNNICDISSLVNCKNLKELYTGLNTISDIFVLSDMTLEKLNLAQNKLTDIAPLKVSELLELDISENDISDISIMSGASKLTDLNIGDNAIIDISVIGGNAEITKLNISDNCISDISSIAQLTKLKELNCCGNNITDFDILTSLTDLTSLDISNNNVNNISFVSALTHLQQFSVSGCDLYSVDMKNLPNSVERLDVSSNSIADITPFVEMSNLRELNLSNNYISDITGFSTITHDMSLNINENEVSSDNINALHSSMQNSDYYISVANNTPTAALENMYFMNDDVTIKIAEEFVQNVSVIPYNADNSNLVWESSDTNIAEVKDGTVTAKKQGKTVITAKTDNGEITASYNLTVIDDMIQNIYVNSNNVSLSLKNISDTNYNSVILVVGIYDSSEILIDIKTVPISNFVSGYTDDAIQLSFDSIPTDSQIKVFLLKSLTDMKPLCDSREIAVSE